MPRGFVDQRHRVSFQEGAEIFRTYKGVKYRAKATGGYWYLENDGKLYNSLNRLSAAVTASPENAWQNWKCNTSDGEVSLAKLRGQK